MKEDRAIHETISTQNLDFGDALLTEPFDNSVAHASCKLCRIRQHLKPLVALVGYG